MGLTAHWQSIEDCDVPKNVLKNWLLDTSSLTERLQAQCQQFSLHLIGQRQISPELEEFQRLGQTLSEQQSQQWQIREVILCGDGKPWVFARSVLPNALCNSDLAELGARPLGQILFNDQRFKRLPFELTQISPSSEFHRKLKIQSNHALWGRRSLFSYQSHNMMVAEIFLPDAPAYRQC